MIMAGDEFLRTQNGNNNAWCQDNTLGWVDWSLKDRNADFARFVRLMIAFRQTHHVLRRRTFFTGERGGLPPEIVWHGVDPAKPDFSYNSRSLACALDGRRSDRPQEVDRDIYVAMNAYWKPLPVRIPGSPSGRAWRRAVDTSLLPPDDIMEEDKRPHVPVLQIYRVQAHSLIILVSEKAPRQGLEP
jgi:isoamylase